MAKKKTYKTLVGFFKAYGQNNIPVSEFFSFSGVHLGNNRYAIPTQDLKNDVAKEVCKQLWTSRSPNRVRCLANGWGDLQCLRFFYINLCTNMYGGKYLWVDNSISGDAYESCKRRYTKSIS